MAKKLATADYAYDLLSEVDIYPTDKLITKAEAESLGLEVSDDSAQGPYLSQLVSEDSLYLPLELYTVQIRRFSTSQSTLL